MVKYMQNVRKKQTAPVTFKTLGGEFQSRHQSKVEILIPELYEIKIWHLIYMWMTHVGNIITMWYYDMIYCPNNKYIYVSLII